MRRHGCALPTELIASDFDRRVSMVTYSQVEFGVIPHDHWFQPYWIDEDKASKARKQMEENNVIYGGAPPQAWATGFL